MAETHRARRRRMTGAGRETGLDTDPCPCVFPLHGFAAKTPGTQATSPAGRARRCVEAVVRVATWGYLVAAIAVWVVLRTAGDRWWVATLMLFGPRWVYATPMLVLAPLALAFRRRLLWAIGLALVIVLVPIMGFCFPWARLAAATGPRLRVLTYNVDGGAVGRDAMAALVGQVQPDVIHLQECPAGFYDEVFRGWHVCSEGGLFIASRFPVHRRDSVAGVHPPHQWPRQSMLLVSVEGPFGEIGLCNVHLPSPLQYADG